jgi:hypothetical protein
MARSRSSFELETALASVASLGQGPAKERPVSERFGGVALVSFGQPQLQPDAPPIAAPPPPIVPQVNVAPSVEPPSISTESVSSTEEQDATRRPPKLPDLTGVMSPTQRCARIVEWVAEATGATDVFLADASGLPIAGAIEDAEARLANAGLVATSVGSLIAAIPGRPSAIFELHVGEGPFFQLIGFPAGSAQYLVGLMRATPLTPRQAHAIRLACRHALGETLGGVA